MAFLQKESSSPQASYLPSTVPNEHIVVLRRAITGTIRNIDPVEGCLQQTYLITTRNGSRSLLKFSPLPTVRLLQNEHNTLAIEAHVVGTMLLNRSSNRLETYETVLSPSYLHIGIGNAVPFSRLGQLDEIKLRTIQQSLWLFFMSLSSASSMQYGPLQPPGSTRGDQPLRPSWRLAFTHMVDMILLEAEDSLVHLPHQRIRHYVRLYGHTLDSVTTPKLVMLDGLKKSNLLVDPISFQVQGLVETWNAVWGDQELALCGLGPAYFANLTGTLLPRIVDEPGKARRLL